MLQFRNKIHEDAIDSFKGIFNGTTNYILSRMYHENQDFASMLKEAQDLGCTYITAGHIFLTDCKKGLPGRGLPFLEEICKTVRIPVYAIGGISSQNIESVRKTGAAGACIMSGFMRCKTVEEIM